MNNTLKKIAAFVVCTTLVAPAAIAAACSGKDDEASSHEHSYTLIGTSPADCETEGTNFYRCSYCGQTKKEAIEPLGHDFAETSASVAYLLPCKREGCNVGKLPDNDDSYKAKIVCTFTDNDKEQLTNLITEIKQSIADVGLYDGEQYDESSDLFQSFNDVYDKTTEYMDLAEKVYYQMRYARITYDVNPSDEDAESTYQSIYAYSTQVFQDYYDTYKPFADSKYRNYAYYGMSDDEIAEFLAYYEESSDENSELTVRNNDILIAVNALDDTATSTELPELYAEFVANNNKIAQNYGYDNYMEYAYENIYGRNYTYQDVQQVANYIKKYISPLYSSLYSRYATAVKNLPSQSAADEYNGIMENSFFSDVISNKNVNNFFELISTYGTINFAQTFVDMLNYGNYYACDYEGAYTTYLGELGIPVILYGTNYQHSFTIVHEFGHYSDYLYNEYINENNYDLSETQSQGLEMLYLNYLKTTVSSAAYTAIEYGQLTDYAATIIGTMAVNLFEQAVYTNSYTGSGSNKIMADGKITSDEYDALYKYVLSDLGYSAYGNSAYWRYVTVSHPCYYVSYSVSLLGSFQLFVKAENESLEAAVESYTKLITFTDEHSDYDYSEVLEYAGLNDFRDEQLFIDINALLKKK